MNAIGIDLGTTNSCAGIWQNGHVEIIPNEYGKRTTPSVVSFGEEERFIGEDALRQLNRNPRNTIYEIKRFIGRSMDDPQVQSDLGQYSYYVCDPTGENRPQVYCSFRNEECLLYPEEVSAMILNKMRELCKIHTGGEIYKAVITVPAYFNDSQRQATKDAGEIAGLQVLRVLNEPTAAAIAYGLDKKYEESEDDKNILVFDLGGGTFDVSLLSLGSDGIFEVLAISGDSHLGGADFDQRLMKHIINRFETKYRTKVRLDNYKALQKIRIAAEKAKCSLSASQKAYVDIDSLVDGIDFQMMITRSEFEEMCSDLFDRCFVPVKQVLSDAKMDTSNVDDIVLVGGSTRIPKIQQLLSGFFDDKELCKSINPDEAVAYGAAIHAGILGQTAENFDETLPDYVLLDVAPLSLGIETAGGLMTVLIPRNTTIPITKSKMFSTAEDNQDSVTVQVYEGERTETKNNRLLGTFDLEGIEPAPRGVAQIQVTYKLDADGIFTVSASDVTKGIDKGSKKELHIKNDKGRLSPDEISEVIDNAKKFEEQDNKFKKLVQHRNNYENILYSMRSLADSDPKMQEFGTSEDRDMLRSVFKEETEWLEANGLRDIDDVSVYKDKMNYIHEKIVNPVVERVNEKIRIKKMQEEQERISKKNMKLEQ